MYRYRGQTISTTISSLPAVLLSPYCCITDIFSLSLYKTPRILDLTFSRFFLKRDVSNTSTKKKKKTNIRKFYDFSLPPHHTGSAHAGVIIIIFFFRISYRKIGDIHSNTRMFYFIVARVLRVSAYRAQQQHNISSLASAMSSIC